MRLCLVEDLAASGLEPLTLTRPVHELLLGADFALEQDYSSFSSRAGTKAAQLCDPSLAGRGSTAA